MLAQTRKDKILEMLKEDDSVKVAGLSKIFKVSEVTIRQDLEKLEQEGIVTREHGGAFLNGTAEAELLKKSFINKLNF